MQLPIVNRLRYLYWWITDPQWRRKFRAIQKRISLYHQVQRLVVKQIVSQRGDQILAGPFIGLTYTPARENVCCAHVLLGTYEKELHQIIDAICGESYETIIDIGVSDGFYLCGLAVRNPKTRLIGFELELRKHPKIRALAKANGVADSISVYGACDFESLNSVLQNCGKCLIVCDIDGGEIEVLDPARVSGIQNIDILVETHDLLVPAITERLIERFDASHEIARIDSQPRMLSDLPQGISLSEADAIGAMDEFRGGQQSWLWMRSKVCQSAMLESRDSNQSPQDLNK